MSDKDLKVIENIEREISKIDKKENRIFFFVIDTKGVPSGSLEYIYNLALILKEEGYDVTGITLTLCDKDNSGDINDAKAVCEKLGIGHIVLDLRDEFQKYVISDFINEYKEGRTPNPCIVCNKNIKFGAMLDYALKSGFDKIIRKYCISYFLLQ